MHELSIAMSLVEIAIEERLRLGLGAIEALHVRIGPLSGVVPDALMFSFDMAAAGTAIEGARLAIECVPAAIYCDRCQAERDLPSVHMRCPVCAEVARQLIRGRELQLTALEVVDGDAPHR